MWGTFHICPQRLQEQSTHTGHTCICPCHCRGRRPPSRTPRCCCCSYSIPPSNRFHSDTPHSHTLHDLQAYNLSKNARHTSVQIKKWPYSAEITHLHRAPPGNEHRSNCHTHSKDRRCVQSWMRGTHTSHSNSPPGRCILQSHWWQGSYLTKHSPHCIRTGLQESLGGTRTRHSGTPPDPRCIDCCWSWEAAGSRRSRATPGSPPSCPEGPLALGRSGELLTDMSKAPRTH